MGNTPSCTLSRRRLLLRMAGFAATAFPAGWSRAAFATSPLRERVSGSAIERFRKQLTGRIVLPADPAYEAFRRVASFNPVTDKRPALIVNCANADDVARAVIFAREHTLEIAVRGGGHDVLGQSVCDGGMVINFVDMRAIAVDREKGLVIAQAGVRAGALDARLREHGRVAALGCNPAVGISGLTLGGGLGWFIGKYGAACDNLLEADVVTVDGCMLRTSENQHPDLFWALKGGGGNFGIATSLTYRTHHQPRVTGGFLAYRGELLPDFLRFYQTFMANAPDELTVEMFMFTPRNPIIFVMVCHSGEERMAKRALAPLEAFAKPLAGGIQTVAYGTPPPEDIVQLMQREPATASERTQEEAADYVYWKGVEVRNLSEAGIETFVARVNEAPPGYSVGIGHYQHGAVCLPGPDDSALPRRCGSANIFYNTGWRGVTDAARNMRWVDESIAAMQPFASAGTYVNYLSDASTAAVKASYGDRYERLSQLKKRYDPDNVLHLNRNVMPAS